MFGMVLLHCPAVAKHEKIASARFAWPPRDSSRDARTTMAQHILAVDDEPQILRIVQVNLEKAGYQVSTASNGREALEAVRAKHPDLVIMDVTMPEMNGLDALKALKADEATASVPVVMLTANAEDEDVMTGWQNGAHAYLNKPLNVRELLNFIQSILSADTGDKHTYEVTVTD